MDKFIYYSFRGLLISSSLQTRYDSSLIYPTKHRTGRHQFDLEQSKVIKNLKESDVKLPHVVESSSMEDF